MTGGTMTEEMRRFIYEARDRLLAAGIVAEHLDEFVQEAAGHRASDVNNGGVVEQLTFLYESLGPNGVVAVEQELLGEGA